MHEIKNAEMQRFSIHFTCVNHLQINSFYLWLKIIIIYKMMFRFILENKCSVLNVYGNLRFKFNKHNSSIRMHFRNEKKKIERNV